MKKVIGLLILVLALAACGGTDEVVETAVDQVEEAAAVVEETAVEVVEEAAAEVVEEVVVEEVAAVESGEEIRLQADYADALAVQSQLALGTLKLEDSPQAVNEAQAADLLPLWRAYQSLSESNITADVEMEALLNQIQGKMTTAQLQAIVALSLTAADVDAMLEDGTLSGAMRGGGGKDGGSSGSSTGGPGGGMGGPGGGGGSDLGAVDQDEMATRRAERFGDEDPEAAFQEVMLVGAVTQLMGVKTGEVNTSPGGFTIIFDTIAAELGMDVDTLRTEAGGDGSLADIIVANGGDVDVMHALLLTALADSDVASTQDDLGAFVTEALHR